MDESKKDVFWVTRTSSIHLFLLVIGLLFLYWAFDSALTRLTRPFPQSPWESQILVDAARFAEGQHVYTNPNSPTGHSTVLYGPLSVYVVGLTTKYLGYSLYTPRILSFCAAILLCTVLAFKFSEKRLSPFTLFAFALLFYQFYRGRAYFAEARPDALAVLFAAGALWCFYEAYTRNRMYLLIGLPLMLIGMLFKQTASAVAAIPITYILLSRCTSWSQYAWASIPLLAVAFTTLVIKLLAPNVYFYVYVVSTRFEMQPYDWPMVFLDLFTCNTFALVWLLLALIRVFFASFHVPTWWVATLLIGIGSVVPVVAKAGGGENSYIPAYLVIATFGIRSIQHWLNSEAQIQHKWVSPLLLVLLLADAFALHGSRDWYKPGPSNGDSTYPLVIAATKELPGSVASPDDPTIAWLAKGTFCRGVVIELDTTAYKALPPSIIQEWSRTDYLITTRGMWTSKVPVGVIRNLGFAQVKHQHFNERGYTLWHREHN